MSMGVNSKIAVVVGAIVVVGVVIASLASSWTVSPRDPNSPEGVVQTYMQAVVDHDTEAALSLLEPGTKCTISNFQQTYYDRSSRVTLVDVNTTGDRATVHVRIEHSNGDPFGGTWDEEQYFQLLRTGEAWRILGTPWPVYSCGEMVK